MIITVIGDSPNVVIDVGRALSWLIEFALFEANYFLRGSMSYGDIVQLENYVVGPAIFNAAEIYEQDQWIGISVAENTDEILNDLNTNNSDLLNPAHIPIFRQFDLPRKNKKCKMEIKKNTWVVNWPLRESFLSTCMKHELDLDEIDNRITNIMRSLPCGAREKWNVTRRFLGLDEIT